MDWPLDDPTFSGEDLDNVFIYASRGRTGVCRFVGDEDLSERSLDGEDLLPWLQDMASKRGTPGIVALLGDSAETNLKGVHNPQALRNLPFTRQEFEQVINLFSLHGDTARVINRSDFAFFSDVVPLTGPGKAIYYCCRTDGTYPGDLAVSAVFFPETGHTAAIVLGSSDRLSDELAGRIENSEEAFVHPLLLFGILIEVEKKRHLRLVDTKVYHLLKRVHVLSHMNKISSTSEISSENYSVDLWIEVSRLRIALRAWQQELAKVEEHITMLERDFLTRPAVYDAASSAGSNSDGSMTETLGPTLWRDSAIVTGRRMQKRLREIKTEYDLKVQECTMVLDGMALSTQLSWSQIGYQDTQANLEIAKDTRQDSSQMRSIAFLTMLFLPATFIASFFSTTFFNFQPSESESVLSPYIWIYPVVTIAVTAIVMFFWIYFTKRRRDQAPSLKSAAIDGGAMV